MIKKKDTAWGRKPNDYYIPTVSLEAGDFYETELEKDIICKSGTIFLSLKLTEEEKAITDRYDVDPVRFLDQLSNWVMENSRIYRTLDFNIANTFHQQNLGILKDTYYDCWDISEFALDRATQVLMEQILVVFFLVSPLLMIGDSGWLTVIFSIPINYLILGVYKMGIAIEDPFADSIHALPIEKYL